jgi:hypothetical protein
VQADFQQTVAGRAAGALLSQLGSCSERQLQLWHFAQWDKQPGLSAGTTHAAAVLQQLERCCSCLRLSGMLDVQQLADAQDPVPAVLQVLMRALMQQQPQSGQGTAAAATAAVAASGTPPVSAQQQQQQQQHPAAVLRQLMDVLLSGLLYKHGLEAQQ